MRKKKKGKNTPDPQIEKGNRKFPCGGCITKGAQNNGEKDRPDGCLSGSQ